MVRLDHFSLVLNVSGSLRRIAKVKFRHDGSIFVFFPDFTSTKGILCHASLAAGATYPTDLDLTNGGKVASHLVKYVHHVDGEAHFSQDKKVLTEIRRKAAPLTEQTGHLFTIMAQNFQSFAKLPTAKAKQLTINVPADLPAIKIVCSRFRSSDLSFQGDIPPGATPIIQIGGIDRQGLLVAPPVGMKFDDFVLFISPEGIPPISDDKSAQLTFLGGFDPTSIALNHTHDTGFLAFAYPCSNFEALKKSIGSIDLQLDGKAHSP